MDAVFTMQSQLPEQLNIEVSTRNYALAMASVETYAFSATTPSCLPSFFDPSMILLLLVVPRYKCILPPSY